MSTLTKRGICHEERGVSTNRTSKIVVWGRLARNFGQTAFSAVMETGIRSLRMGLVSSQSTSLKGLRLQPFSSRITEKTQVVKIEAHFFFADWPFLLFT